MKAARFASILLVVAARAAVAQHAHSSADAGGAAGDMTMSDEGAMARPHLHLSPMRVATQADTARTLEVVRELRGAIAKYADTSAAIADGYVFRPRLGRTPKVYHFTKRQNALRSAFEFDPAQPTSVLYVRQPDGSLKLLGAMYTAPKRISMDDLDARLPLSIATWHQHVGDRFKGGNTAWMVHVNVFAGDDLGTIFKHGH
ncbi:MAG TPA: hypothetical protein VJ867_01135 [Gemmatimonadaceae bacterium]|nr:hypothetical protein [Gemmatimonadaceae bacterium]